jgi:Transglutaminase-like superfamily
MRTRLIILLLTLLVLVGLSGGYVVGGLQSYSRYQQSSFANQEHCGDQPPVHICVRVPAAIFSAYYPSYVASQHPPHLFTVEYSSASPIELVVSMSIKGMSQVQVTNINATNNLQSVNILPPLIPQNLRKLTNEDHTSLRVQVTDNNKHLYYLNDIPLVLHSRWVMQWITANRLDIGAWVTPNDPAIGALVLKAANHLPLEPPPVPSAMVGYSKANAREVIAQVDAIYDALRVDYKIRYLQASVPYSGSGDASAATQNIKLPSEVLQQGSGMCIELALLLASAVEHIGLHAEIVIIPGHAFLGVAVTPDNKHFEYWDAVQVNNNVVGDSANVATDDVYTVNSQQHTIVDTILISDARNANIDAML